MYENSLIGTIQQRWIWWWKSGLRYHRILSIARWMKCLKGYKRWLMEMMLWRAIKIMKMINKMMFYNIVMMVKKGNFDEGDAGGILCVSFIFVPACLHDPTILSPCCRQITSLSPNIEAIQHQFLSSPPLILMLRAPSWKTFIGFRGIFWAIQSVSIAKIIRPFWVCTDILS